MDSEIQAIRALARASSLLERASGDLSLAHYRVLAAIASGDQRASRVAAKLALGRPAVSAAVDSLGRRGLVARHEVEHDQRAVSLRLTDAGERALARAEEQMLERLGDLCGRVPDAGRLLEALTWLGVALDERGAERWAQRSPGAIGSARDRDGR